MTSEKKRTDHDRLFKELLRTFFKQFMELFYPEIDALIDYDHVKFLSEQVFTDVTAGEKHNLDVVVETKFKGETALILIHFEPQSYYQVEFSEREFIYFSRLYQQYRCKIIPIALFKI